MSDYTNRVYDYLALQVDVLNGGPVELALFNEKNLGQICVGAQKLAQRWLLEFMTELGSMPGLPTRGTNFMTVVRRGTIRTTAAIIAQFNFSAYTAKINLQNEETDAWPPDERFLGAELNSVIFAPGSAKLYVSIYSRAGNNRQIILPITTLPTHNVV